MNIVDEISKQGSDKEKLAKEVIESPELIPQLLEGLNNPKGTIRLGCEKTLRLISEQQPKLIYPHFDTFAKMLDSENNILKWGAIMTISNLVSVDSNGEFEKIFEKYFSSITDKTMITASNVIKNAWKIAMAKPESAEDITQQILKAEKARYENKGQVSPECNNIVRGHAIDSFDKFYDRIRDKKPVLAFIKRQLNNTRKPVSKKAERFLSRHKIDL